MLDKLINKVEVIDAQIHELKSTIAVRLNELNEQRTESREALDTQLLNVANSELKNKKYGCGTANFTTDMHKIKVVVSKKVKWDEKKIKAVENLIKNAGRDPEDFIKYKRSISEKDYNGFTEDVQNMFLPARSVEASAPKITIEKGEV